MGKDIENACALCEARSNLLFLKGSTILITGATGLIGGALARTLTQLNKRYDLGLELILPLRSPDRLREDLRSAPGVTAFQADLTKQLVIDRPVDYIIHAASPTASRELTEESSQSAYFMKRSAAALLELAKAKQVRKYLYLSSMEVYNGLSGPVTEVMCGSFDPVAPRSCYPLSKLYGEALCRQFAEKCVPAVNVRLAQTFGEGISDRENRVFAQFAKSAIAGKDIVLRTEGSSIGNYLHISDCVSALILLMEKGAGGETYNAAGDDCHMTIRKLAEETSELLSGGKSRITFDPAPIGSYPPDSAFILDNSKLKSLGWTPEFGVPDMILSLGRELKGEAK